MLQALRPIGADDAEANSGSQDATTGLKEQHTLRCVQRHVKQTKHRAHQRRLMTASPARLGLNGHHAFGRPNARACGHEGSTLHATRPVRDSIREKRVGDRIELTDAARLGMGRGHQRHHGVPSLT